MNVYIFKTSVKKRDVKIVEPFLDKTFPNTHWNFDFDDCDRVLRIESDKDVSDLVCDSICKLGFLCAELE